ncbi:hypothetical protein [Streptacidiphilus albus]|uniref:hypothetical protein n=1 Tax=Streptacidiphilus albus TaxID=105425 RepID=UPI00054C3704|nr:hypothetical protein [Streptacidiphilus albus]
MAIAFLVMFVRMECVYMPEGTARNGCGLPTGRRTKPNATSGGAAQWIKYGAVREQAAAELGVSRSTLNRELRNTEKVPLLNPPDSKVDHGAGPHPC